MDEQQKQARIEKWQKAESPFYRRWRVYSTFFTGFAIGLFYVLLISEGVLPWLKGDNQDAVVLVFSGIMGGVIYTIVIDGHVEMPEFVASRGDRFKAGLFGDILLGIAGAIVLHFIAVQLFRSNFTSSIELAAAGIVGGYGGRAILQFALQRVFKDINILEVDRQAYLQANLQRQLTRMDSLELIDLINQQIKVGLVNRELSALRSELEQADSGTRRRVFRIVQDSRLTAKAAGEPGRIERLMPVLEALIKADPDQHVYYAELAFAYKDLSSPDLLQAIQYLNKAIALRGSAQLAETWNYELSRAVILIQKAYRASDSYEFDPAVHEQIIADLLAVAEIYNLETILKEVSDQNIPLPIINWMEHNEAMLAAHPKAKVLIEKLEALVGSEPVGSEPAASFEPPAPRSESLSTVQPQPQEVTVRALVNPELARWQQALVQAKPAGASSQTASQDGLRDSGVSASHKMAKTDWPRIEPLVDRFCVAGEKFDIPPALLAAIASRESRCGNTALLVNGWGDHGNAFGIMQVDKRFHDIADGGRDSGSQSHIHQATSILAKYLQEVQQRHPTWSDQALLEGAAVAYNSGVSNVRTLLGMNKGTTGNDYGADVIARAQFYNQHCAAFSIHLAATKQLDKAEQGTHHAWMEAVRETWLKRSPDPADLVSSAYKKACSPGTRYEVESYQKARNNHYLVKLAHDAGEWYIFDSERDNHWDTTWENDHGEADESGERKRKDKGDNTKDETPKRATIGGQLTKDMPFDTLITPHIAYGEFALYQEARRFNHNYQCKVAYEICLFLEQCREHFGNKPLTITSGYRPWAINLSVKGAPNSEHLYDHPEKGAVDFYIDGVDIYELQRWCDQNYPHSIGYGAYKGFIHLGFRPGKERIRWPY